MRFICRRVLPSQLRESRRLPDLPWTTGPRPFAHRHALEVIDGAEPKAANRSALDALMHGASSLLFWVHRAEDLPVLLHDIRLDIAPVHLVYGGNVEDVMAVLRALPNTLHPRRCTAPSTSILPSIS